MKKRREKEAYLSACVEVKLFEEVDLITTSEEAMGPDAPEDNLGMWS